MLFRKGVRLFGRPYQRGDASLMRDVVNLRKNILAIKGDAAFNAHTSFRSFILFSVFKKVDLPQPRPISAIRLAFRQYQDLFFQH